MALPQGVAPVWIAAAAIIPPGGYDASQPSYKRIEEDFGWIKTIAGLAKNEIPEQRRVAQGFDLAVAAYNLVLLPMHMAKAEA